MTPYRQRTDHRAMDGHDPKCATFRALPRDAHTISHISQLNQQYEHLEVLIRQRKVLISQYESDAARLDLQLQAMKHARTHAYPATCQFCHSPIHMSVPTEQDILIVSTEIEHIHRYPSRR